MWAWANEGSWHKAFINANDINGQAQGSIFSINLGRVPQLKPKAKVSMGKPKAPSSSPTCLSTGVSSSEETSTTGGAMERGAAAAPRRWSCMAFEATAPAGGRLRRWRCRPRCRSRRRGRRAGRRRQPREKCPEPKQQRRTPMAIPARPLRNGRLLGCCPFSSH